MIIDPLNITDYNRNTEKLQVFWLFCMMVAGKNATHTASKLTAMMEGKPKHITPFAYLAAKNLPVFLREHKTGQYSRLVRAFSESFGLNLRECDVEKLESVFGIGPKTARFFLLHSRRDAKFAVLDTHILKYLKTKTHDVPKSTPLGKKYDHLERLFFKYIALDFPSMSIADADLYIWKSYKLGVDNFEEQAIGYS